MRWSWNVTTDKPHVVEAVLSLVSSRETVAVDGEVVSNAYSMRFRNRHEVPLGPGRSGAVEVSSTWYGAPRCRLVVDGVEIPAARGVGPGRLVVPRDFPWWTWIFFVLCGAIPVVALGGAIPVLVGVGGIVACGAVAGRKSVPVAARIGICAAITAACWAGFIAVLLAIAALRGTPSS